MAAKVVYVNGPAIVRDKGEMRGEAVMWVRVGESDKLREACRRTRKARLRFPC